MHFQTTSHAKDDDSHDTDLNTIMEANDEENDFISVDLDAKFDEENARVYCSARCTSCKTCKCVKGHHTCIHEGENRCHCDPEKCENKTERETDPEKFAHYTQKEFTPVDTSFDDSNVGPNPEFFSKLDSPFKLLMTSIGDENIERIIRDTNLNWEFQQQHKHVVKDLKQYYIDFTRWKAQERKWKSDQNIGTTTEKEATTKKPKDKKNKIDSEVVVTDAMKNYMNPKLTRVILDKPKNSDESTQTTPAAEDAENTQTNSDSGQTDASQNTQPLSADNSAGSATHTTPTRQTSTRREKPVKPSVPNFDEWKKDRTPTKNHVFDRTIFEKFIKVLIAMGMNTVQGGYFNYWKNDPLFRNTFIAKLMSKDQFIKCMKYLMYDQERFENNLNDNWKKMYNPSQKLSIDETLIRLLKKFSFQQYNPSKPAKRGIKYLALACARTGYLIMSKMYKGSKSTFPTTPQGIVTYFIDSMKSDGKNYIYAFDNWFTTYDLVLELADKGTPFVGTTRSNRPSWLWKNLTDKVCRERGLFVEVVSEDGKHVAMSHHHNSNKPVNFFTNLASGETAPSVETNNTALPKISVEYKFGMGGVDKSDKYVSNANLFPYKTNSVLKRDFLTRIAQCVGNAKAIHKDLHPEKKTGFAEFKMMIVKEGFSDLKVSQHFVNAHMHFTKKLKMAYQSMPIKDATGKVIDNLVVEVRLRTDYEWNKHDWSYFDPKPHCVYCKANGKKSRTCYTCAACGVALHPTCMLHYHVEQNKF